MKTPAAPLLILGFVLAACGDPESTDASDSEIRAGMCVAKEVDDQGDRAPDLTSVVDCSKPHIYEALAVADLPKRFVTGKTKEERIANRNALARPDGESKERAAFVDFADATCAAALRKVTGYDDITIRGVDAEKAMIRPLFDRVEAPWFNVMPEGRWLAGQTQLICSARFTVPIGSPSRSITPTKSVSSKDGESVLARARFESLPVDYRYCRVGTSAGDEAQPGPCDKPHYSEVLFDFNAENVLGADFLKEVDPAKVTDDQYRRLDEVCTDALPQLLGRNFDPQVVKGGGEPGGLWDDTDVAKYVYCEVKSAGDSRKEDLPAGSLVTTVRGKSVDPK